MLKILQASLQQYMNRELPDVQAGFRKGRGTRDQIVNIRWIIEKAREFQKNIYFCFIDYAKAFDCVDHNKLWKILKEAEIPEKISFHSTPKERQCQECSNYHIVTLISCTSKIMLKILQTRLQQYMNHEIPDVQAGFRKGKEPEIKLPKSVVSLKKQESSRKTSTSALLTMPKPLTV